MEKVPSSKLSISSPWICRSCHSLFRKGLHEEVLRDKAIYKGSPYLIKQSLILAEGKVSLEAIEKAANEGCSICYMLVRQNDFQFLQDQASRSSQGTKELRMVPKGAVVECTWNDGTIAKGPAIISRSYSTTLKPVLSGDTSSKESCDWVKSWFNRCNESHVCFDIQNVPDDHPKRLIDLKPDGTSGAVRVIECKINNVTGHYVTLSHCWGKSIPRKLDKHTAKELERGFSVSTLPQTFQDAVIVCEWLGVRYLWIDSLCIMQDQDGNSEWAKESLRMAQIYGNALFTIAASSAKDSSEGLFRARHPGWIQPHVFARHVSLGSSQTISEKLYVADQAFWDLEVENSALSGRAWAFQERLLSSRKLFFGDSQIYWECRDDRTCEGLQEFGLNFKDELRLNTSADDVNNLGIFLEVLKFSNKTGRTVGKSGLEQKIRDLWLSLVERYSTCELTRNTDKLVAISGLAKMVSTAIGDDTVAGLLRSDLHRGLIWEKLPLSRRAETYQAPSFSWASIQGRINYLRPSFSEKHMIIEDLAIQKQMIVEDTTIQLNEDKLVLLSERMLRVEARLSSLDETYKSFCKFDYEVNHYDDPTFWAELKTKGIYTAFVGKSNRTLPGTAADSSLQVRCDFWYLILEHCKGATYQRIGLFHEPDQTQEEYDHSLNQSRLYANNIPCEHYNKNTGRHTFLII